MTVAGIALITMGFAILVGFRRVLWGGAGERRRGRASRRNARVAAPAGAVPIGSRPAKRPDPSSRGVGGAVILKARADADEREASEPDTEVTVPRPRRSRRSRRRAARSVPAGPAAAGPHPDDEDEAESYGLASIGLADDDHSDGLTGADIPDGSDVSDGSDLSDASDVSDGSDGADGPDDSNGSDGSDGPKDSDGLDGADRGGAAPGRASSDAAGAQDADSDRVHGDKGDSEGTDAAATALRDSLAADEADDALYDVEDPEGEPASDRDRADFERADRGLADSDLANHDEADLDSAGLDPADHDLAAPEPEPAGPGLPAEDPDEEARRLAAPASFGRHLPGLDRPGLDRPGREHPAPGSTTFAEPPSGRRWSSDAHPHGDRIDGWVRPDYRSSMVDQPVGGEYWTPVNGDPYGDRNTGGYGRPSESGWPYRPDYADDPYGRRHRYPPAYDAAPRPHSAPDTRDTLPTGDPWDQRGRVSPSAYPMDGPVWAGSSDPGPALPDLAWTGRDAVDAEGGPGVDDANNRDGYLGAQNGGGYRGAGDGGGGYRGAGDGGGGYRGADDAGESFHGPDRQDRDGGHLPRRSRAATANSAGQSWTSTRAGARAESWPAADSPYRGRSNPRADAHRRPSAEDAADKPGGSGESDAGRGGAEPTLMLPPVPVVQGYGPDNGRADSGRSRQAESTGRPRPRPRPRPGGQAGDDRQPNRSTVYVSRHAAEPS